MPRTGSSGPYGKICERCGEHFVARAKNQRFCSPQHGLYQKKVLEKKICETCGAEFAAGRNDKRVCGSRECLAKLQKARAFTWRLKAFGIDDGWYERKFDEQNGVCAICKKPEMFMHKGVIANLSLDHNHATMQVRALLCRKCNTGIGQFDENIEILKSAIEYLEKFR